MIGTTFLANALCLPLDDWQALVYGRTIAALPWNFLSSGQSFAIISDSALETGNCKARFWARCELCQSIDKAESLDILSKLTLWTKQTLDKKLEERDFFFLAYLRVYEMPQPAEVIATAKGAFLPLQEPVMLSNPLPVLSDRAFAQRKHQLENLESPEHPELEELHRAIAPLAIINPNAKAFAHDIESFLGWANTAIAHQSDLDWINTIAAVGNSSNGDLFEKLARRGLVKLGFSNSNTNPQASLDPNGCGGAGGLDFYCEEPYPVAGECKATKTDSVPDGTPAQLVKLGYRHLQERFDGCIKIILAAGQLNGHAKQTATGNKMNVLRPETLQKLVELKAKHPGAVNLLELKPCLEQAPFGEEADDKVNRYVDQAWQQIKVRAHIVSTLKKYLDDKKLDSVEFKRFYGVYDGSNAATSLSEDDVYEILKELSSPLTGYLGRKKGSDGSDRFYFLRDLSI